jgi:hypothetical protein
MSIKHNILDIIEILNTFPDYTVAGWLIFDKALYLNNNTIDKFIKVYCDKKCKNTYTKSYFKKLLATLGFIKIYDSEIIIYTLDMSIKFDILLNFLKKSKDNTLSEVIEGSRKICTFLDPLVKDSIKALLSLKNENFQELEI